MPPTDPLTELAYRRGYYEGYEAALRDLAAGANQEQLRYFFMHKLKDWRYSEFRRRKNPPRLEEIKTPL